MALYYILVILLINGFLPDYGINYLPDYGINYFPDYGIDYLPDYWIDYFLDALAISDFLFSEFNEVFTE